MQTKTVVIYELSEKTPDENTMILADDGSNWYVLMHDADGIAYEWEGQRDPVEFVRWAYLGDLS